MSQYLLSVHDDECGVPTEMTEDEMKESMEAIGTLEQELHSKGAFVYSGRLHGTDTATVVRIENGAPVMTDGPFVEAKEHIAGFYIINADDLDAALAWAAKVTQCVNAPIEVRPFFEMPAG